MAGRIPRPFIDDVLSRTDIVELIHSRVPLKRTGNNYSACCPFHNEKTPSFSVSQPKQFYYCFGCSASGNAISFLMEFDHMDFVEALEHLAKQQGLEIPREMEQQRAQRPQQDLFPLMDEACKFYQHQLKHHPDAIKARDYLQRRGLTGEVAKAFRLGYAPPGWENLAPALGDSAQLQKQLLECGLTITKNQNRSYDRFRDRIVFPIRDHRGRVIGFGGRVLGDDTPKYLNSPETPIFHKGSELYGLYEWLQTKNRPEYALIVEGYMDVIALAQFGFPQAVATLGTATSKRHIERLFRYTDQVIFCFDGDNAGQQAAWRALEMALPLAQDNHQIKFLLLPEKHDPDSYLREQGEAAWQQAIINAIPLSDFFFKRISQELPAGSLDEKARYAHRALPLLEQLPKGLLHKMMLERLADHLRLTLEQLREMVKKSPEQTSATNAPKETGKTKMPLINYLLAHPELAQSVDDLGSLRALQEPQITLLLDLLEILQREPNLTTGTLLERYRNKPELEILTQALSRQSVLPPAGIAAEFNETMERYYNLARKQEIETLLGRASSGELDDSQRKHLQDLINQQKISR